MQLPRASAFLLLCFSLSFGQGLRGNVKLTGNTKIWVTNHDVTLTWSPSPNAGSYNVFRGTKDGGPYAKIKTGLTDPVYVDLDVHCGQRLYYVVTAVSGDLESTYSNQAVAVIP